MKVDVVHVVDDAPRIVADANIKDYHYGFIGVVDYIG